MDLLRHHQSLSLPIDRPSRHHGNPSFPRHHEALALTLLGTTSIVSDPPKASYLPTYRPTPSCNNLAYSCSACSRSLGWNTVANTGPRISFVWESGEYIRSIYRDTCRRTYRAPNLARHQRQGKGGQRLEKGGAPKPRLSRLANYILYARHISLPFGHLKNHIFLKI
jgi:hypothetical protein